MHEKRILISSLIPYSFFYCALCLSVRSRMPPVFLTLEFTLFLIVGVFSSSIISSNYGNSSEKNPVWYWKDGHNIGNQHSVDKSSEHPDKNFVPYPGSRSSAASWDSTKGKVWMFGGYGFDFEPTEKPRLLNELWVYNAIKESWKAVVSLSSVKHWPEARSNAVMCGVPGVLIFMFGGKGSNGRSLQDTWLYRITSGTWLRLNFVNVTDRQHYPSARHNAVFWCLPDKLVMYGGKGQSGEILEDMWQFVLRSDVLQWKRIPVVTSSRYPDGTYLYPPGRSSAASWVIQNNFLYMFGGITAEDNFNKEKQYSKQHINLADLWKFDAKNNSWMQIHKNPSRAQSSDQSFVPSHRHNAATWTESTHILWFYGGEAFNAETNRFLSDLWKYDIVSGKWSHITMKNELSHTNHPSERSEAITWTYQGTKYLFGGFGLDIRNKTVLLNDLWTLSRENQPDITLSDSRYQKAPQTTILMLSLSLIVGITLTIAALCFLKKTIFDKRRHKATTVFNVRYSPLSQETNFETD